MEYIVLALALRGIVAQVRPLAKELTKLVKELRGKKAVPKKRSKRPSVRRKRKVH